MPARSVCLVTLSLSEAGTGRFGRQSSLTDIYRTMEYCCRGHNRMLPVFGTSFICALKFPRSPFTAYGVGAHTRQWRSQKLSPKTLGIF